MAAITVNAAGVGYTPAAANGGGDTLVSGVGAGGWGQPTILVGAVGATPTTVTVDGTAWGPYTSQTFAIPVNGGVYKGRSVAVTYSSVTGLTVGATST